MMRISQATRVLSSIAEGAHRYNGDQWQPGVWKRRVSLHEKPNLPEAFHERRSREFDGESGGPPSLPQKKMNPGLAEMQFPAILWGLLALFVLFLIDILSHSQFFSRPILPHPISMQIWTNYEIHIFKSGGYVGLPPDPPVAPLRSERDLLLSAETRFVSRRKIWPVVKFNNIAREMHRLYDARLTDILLVRATVRGRWLREQAIVQYASRTFAVHRRRSSYDTYNT